jgi:hypothetical protein
VYHSNSGFAPESVEVPYVVGLSRNQTFYLPLINNGSNPVDYELPLSGTFNALIEVQFNLQDVFGGNSTSGKLIGTLVAGETRKIQGTVIIPEDLDLGELQINALVPVTFYPNPQPSVTTLILKVYSAGISLIPSFIVIIMFSLVLA